MSPHLIVLAVVVMGSSLLLVTILLLVQAALVLRVASWFNEARAGGARVGDQQVARQAPPSLAVTAH